MRKFPYDNSDYRLHHHEFASPARLKSGRRKGKNIASNSAEGKENIHHVPVIQLKIDRIPENGNHGQSLKLLHQSIKSNSALPCNFNRLSPSVSPRDASQPNHTKEGSVPLHHLSSTVPFLLQKSKSVLPLVKGYARKLLIDEDPLFIRDSYLLGLVSSLRRDGIVRGGRQKEIYTSVAELLQPFLSYHYLMKSYTKHTPARELHIDPISTCHKNDIDSSRREIIQLLKPLVCVLHKKWSKQRTETVWKKSNAALENPRSAQSSGVYRASQGRVPHISPHLDTGVRKSLPHHHNNTAIPLGVPYIVTVIGLSSSSITTSSPSTLSNTSSVCRTTTIPLVHTLLIKLLGGTSTDHEKTFDSVTEGLHLLSMLCPEGELPGFRVTVSVNDYINDIDDADEVVGYRIRKNNQAISTTKIRDARNIIYHHPPPHSLASNMSIISDVRASHIQRKGTNTLLSNNKTKRAPEKHDMKTNSRSPSARRPPISTPDINATISLSAILLPFMVRDWSQYPLMCVIMCAPCETELSKWIGRSAARYLLCIIPQRNVEEKYKNKCPVSTVGHRNKKTPNKINRRDEDESVKKEKIWTDGISTIRSFFNVEEDMCQFLRALAACIISLEVRLITLPIEDSCGADDVIVKEVLWPATPSDLIGLGALVELLDIDDACYDEDEMSATRSEARYTAEKEDEPINMLQSFYSHNNDCDLQETHHYCEKEVTLTKRERLFLHSIQTAPVPPLIEVSQNNLPQWFTKQHRRRQDEIMYSSGHSDRGTTGTNNNDGVHVGSHRYLFYCRKICMLTDEMYGKATYLIKMAISNKLSSACLYPLPGSLLYTCVEGNSIVRESYSYNTKSPISGDERNTRDYSNGSYISPDGTCRRSVPMEVVHIVAGGASSKSSPSTFPPTEHISTRTDSHFSPAVSLDMSHRRRTCGDRSSTRGNDKNLVIRDCISTSNTYANEKSMRGPPALGLTGNMVNLIHNLGYEHLLALTYMYLINSKCQCTVPNSNLDGSLPPNQVASYTSSSDIVTGENTLVNTSMLADFKRHAGAVILPYYLDNGCERLKAMILASLYGQQPSIKTRVQQPYNSHMPSEDGDLYITQDARLSLRKEADKEHMSVRKKYHVHGRCGSRASTTESGNNIAHRGNNRKEPYNDCNARSNNTSFERFVVPQQEKLQGSSSSLLVCIDHTFGSVTYDVLGSDKRELKQSNVISTNKNDLDISPSDSSYLYLLSPVDLTVERMKSNVINPSIRARSSTASPGHETDNYDNDMTLNGGATPTLASYMDPHALSLCSSSTLGNTNNNSNNRAMSHSSHTSRGTTAGTSEERNDHRCYCNNSLTDGTRSPRRSCQKRKPNKDYILFISEMFRKLAISFEEVYGPGMVAASVFGNRCVGKGCDHILQHQKDQCFFGVFLHLIPSPESVETLEKLLQTPQQSQQPITSGFYRGIVTSAAHILLDDATHFNTKIFNTAVTFSYEDFCFKYFPLVLERKDIIQYMQHRQEQYDNVDKSDEGMANTEFTLLLVRALDIPERCYQVSSTVINGEVSGSDVYSPCDPSIVEMISFNREGAQYLAQLNEKLAINPRGQCT